MKIAFKKSSALLLLVLLHAVLQSAQKSTGPGFLIPPFCVVAIVALGSSVVRKCKEIGDTAPDNAIGTSVQKIVKCKKLSPQACQSLSGNSSHSFTTVASVSPAVHESKEAVRSFVSSTVIGTPATTITRDLVSPHTDDTRDRLAENTSLHVTTTPKVRLAHILPPQFYQPMPTFRCDYARDYEEKRISMNVNIFDAINRNDLRSVEILLECKVDVNQKREGGDDYETLLSMVIRGDGNVALIRMLLYHGANPNLNGRYKMWSPLYYALKIKKRKKREEVTEMLLKHGADVNATILGGCTEGTTALVEAVSNDWDGMVRLLLKYGANANLLGAGLIPFTTAAFYGRTNLGRLLLGAGADINQVNGAELTPLVVAIEENKGNFLQWLLENKADVNHKNKRGEIPIGQAIEKNIGVLGMLLGAGADVNQQHWYGWTPLTRMVYEGREKVVQLLLNANNSVDVPDLGGATALFWAIYTSNQKIAQDLVNRGHCQLIIRDGAFSKPHQKRYRHKEEVYGVLCKWWKIATHRKKEDFAATVTSRRYMDILTEELGENCPVVLINLIVHYVAHSSLRDPSRYELQTAFEVWKKEL